MVIESKEQIIQMFQFEYDCCGDFKNIWEDYQLITDIMKFLEINDEEQLETWLDQNIPC